jgi:antitoxin VapB
MAFQVRDSETEKLVRQLAKQEGVGITEAVKLTVSDRLQARRNALSLYERLRRITHRIATLPDTGVRTDKAFYDNLSDV